MFAQENMVSGGVNSTAMSDSSNPIQNTSSTSDLTSGNNATTTSNITSDEQTSGNITSKKGLALLDALEGKSLGEKSLTTGPLKGLQEGGLVNDAPSGPNVVITVTFNSITVHNKHEGAISGDGEFDLYAYVQGRIVRLTDASVGGELYDVENGQTVNFKPGTQIITEIPDTFPLSIFTVGSEVDGCGRLTHILQDNIQQRELPIFFDPQLDWLTPIAEFQDNYNSRTHCGIGNLGHALIDENDILGTIREFYDPPDHGAGSHAVKSSTGDFTLRYTINMGQACNASIC